MQNPTTLLIDLDGVIRRWNPDDAHIERACRLPEGALRLASFAPECLSPAITGAISDAVWRALIAQRLRELYPSSQADTAVLNWSASTGEVDFEVLSVLARCKPSLKMVLATNATSRLDSDINALGITGYFHAIANSSALRAIKPSADFYARALALVGATPDATLFVDDSASNVLAANEFGMLGHHFTGVEGLQAFLTFNGALGAGARLVSPK